jgi:competence protein ComFC
MKPTLLCSDFWLDILYPNRCPGCDRVIAWNKTFCDECESKLAFLEDVPWQSVFPEKIDGEKTSFDYANALFLYKDEAKNAVLALKSKYAVKFAKYAAERLVLKTDADGISSADIVTAVPMHRKKVKARGYNQAEIFAKYIADEMKIKTDFTLLKRLKSSSEQHNLDRKGRLALADKMYYSEREKGYLNGKNIILCDDIFTSGATADKCAGLLKNLGAKKVYVLTICRTAYETDNKNSEK